MSQGGDLKILGMEVGVVCVCLLSDEQDILTKVSAFECRP